MSDDDLKTIEAMKRFGGGFVMHLGTAAMYADDDNLKILKKAFPEYWEKYSRLAVAKGL